MPSQKQAGVSAMGTEGASKNPWIAGILSGALPGLGQFYNRQWLKGVGFLLGTVVVDGVLGLTAGMTNFLQSGAPVGKIVVVALFALAVGAFFYFDLKQYLSLEALKANRDSLLAYTEDHYTKSVVIFILLYCLQTAFSLPGAAIFTVAGGFLFGSFLGTLYTNIAATSGATLAFLAARYLLRDWVEQKFGDRLGPIQEGFAKNAFSYLITLRLVPLFPFFLVNLVSGFTRCQLGTFVAATSI